ncbi:MAG TPA: sigma-70 family RNA polymerase sigma factor [Magnetospirillaceae bacterium]|jgi:RNA polymerase sigma-70 factor (ECF subfamily)
MDEKRTRFEAMMIPHLDAAYSLARWLTRNDTEADDVVQDAFLRAYRAFEGFRGGDARPWLFAIVRNCHRTRWARNRQGSEVPLAEEHLSESDEDVVTAGVLVAEGDDPEMALIRADTATALTGLLGGLPVEYREVLVLREFEDLSYRDIATVIGAPIGTVMSRLARGRALMRARWLALTEEKASHGVR